jgi:hypothetical protein
MSAAKGLAWYAMDSMAVAQSRRYAQLPGLLERQQAYERRERSGKGMISSPELPRALGIAAAGRPVG